MSLTIPTAVRRTRIGSALTILAALAALAVAGIGVAPAHAATCAHPVGYEEWYNVTPSTGDLTKVFLDRGCDNQPYVHAYGRCQPTDCDWGRVQGWSTPDGWTHATFDFGYVKENLTVKQFRTSTGLQRLRVVVHHDFTAADGRTDFVTDEVFKR